MSQYIHESNKFHLPVLQVVGFLDVILCITKSY